ncbi:MAG: ATP synthase F1 subunit epsilon [Erysipelothrix sp.]|jgi:F-type H+-transporting ATPase subunit epsilon|nr:ATP synthase F1 subunit epsilon [Erysipelothrix sp.]
MFKVQVITPLGDNKTIETNILNVRTSNGDIGILANHMPIVAMLQISMMSTIESDGRHRYALAGGVLYFANNVATILTDAIERSDEIDIERAQRAKDRAEKAIKDPNSDIKKAEVSLKRALNRIDVAS